MGPLSRFLSSTLGPQTATITATCDDNSCRPTTATTEFKMGMAWQLFSLPNGDLGAFKNGGTYGFNSAVWIAPALNEGVVVMINDKLVDGGIRALDDEVEDILEMLPGERPAAASSIG
jgi:hypothetical protein